MNEALLSVEGLRVEFPSRDKNLFGKSAPFVAVDDITFKVAKGEVFGIVGGSGAGKTTLLRALIRLLEPAAGRIVFEGKDVTRMHGSGLKDFRRHVHVVFQNPYNAFHPRMTIGQALSEPLAIHKIGNPSEYQGRIADALEKVGMDPKFIDRYPGQFSGGQLQRLGLARALILGADILLADEPVSALDVSIQAQVLNLFQDLKEQLGLTYIIVAHDLAAMRYLCDRTAVMLEGRFVEIGPTDELYGNPCHPYTRALLDSMLTIKGGVAGADLKSVDFGNAGRIHGPLVEISPGHFVEVEPAVESEGQERNEA